MEPWEKDFIDAPLRWGKFADPSRHPPDYWGVFSKHSVPFGYAVFASRHPPPRLGMIVRLTDFNVVWAYYVEREPDSWALYKGVWAKDHFRSLARAYVRALGRPVKMTGPKYAFLVSQLARSYVFHTEDASLKGVGPYLDIIDGHLRRILEDS